jgi:GGDEF domain-containing protein
MRVTTPSAAASGVYAPHASRRRLFWRTIGVTGGILLTFVLSGRLSISIGVACRSFGRDADGSNQDLGEVLFRDADAALYLAKQRGRNRVAFWYSASHASAESSQFPVILE